TSIHVDACISWVTQHTLGSRCGKRPEHRSAADAPGWKTKSLLPKHFPCLASRADTRERLEEMGNRVPDLGVGIEHHVAGLVINEARGQRTTILATPHFVQDTAAQPGFQDVKHDFA